MDKLWYINRWRTVSFTPIFIIKHNLQHTASDFRKTNVLSTTALFQRTSNTTTTINMQLQSTILAILATTTAVMAAPSPACKAGQNQKVGNALYTSYCESKLKVNAPKLYTVSAKSIKDCERACNLEPSDCMFVTFDNKTGKCTLYEDGTLTAVYPGEPGFSGAKKVGSA